MSSDDPQERRDIDFDRLERGKDFAQEAVQSTAMRVGRIATIITGAVVDVAREIGELITDGFEMREAAKLAKADTIRLDRMASDRLDGPGFDEAELDDTAGVPELGEAPSGIAAPKAIEAAADPDAR